MQAQTLTDGVMAALQVLVLLVQVRILVGQQRRKAFCRKLRKAFFYWLFMLYSRCVFKMRREWSKSAGFVFANCPATKLSFEQFLIKIRQIFKTPDPKIDYQLLMGMYQ